MTDRELKVIEQRLRPGVPGDHLADAQALLEECRRLRRALSDVALMTGDPAILATVRTALDQH